MKGLKYTEIFGRTYWNYNLPLQISTNEDGSVGVLNYMPRKYRIEYIDQKVPKDEIKDYCENAAKIFKNLSELFQAFGEGKISTIYYPDETVEAAIQDEKESEQL